jgi:hypothetical protein
MPGTESLGVYRVTSCQPDAHTGRKTQSCAPQRHDDAGHEISVGRDFNTHAFAAFELDLDGSDPREGFCRRDGRTSSRATAARFLDNLDGRKCQRRNNTRF